MTFVDRWNQLQQRSASRGWPMVLLRLVVGFGFAYHGYAKLERGVTPFANVLAAMGVPAPDVMAWLTTLIELIGGIAMMLGAFVVPLAIPFTIIMLVAMFGVHFRYGFPGVRLKALTAAGAEFGPVGYELNVAYIAAIVVLALCPPSAWSIDRWLRGRRTGAGGPAAGSCRSADGSAAHRRGRLMERPPRVRIRGTMMS